MRQPGVVRQFVLLVTAALVTVVLLVKADIVGRLVYSAEKGRIRALRESLPSSAEMAARFEPDRAVVATVLPAVVSISTERVLTRADFEGLDPRLHRFLFPDRKKLPTDPKEEGEDSDEALAGEDEGNTNGPSPSGRREPLLRLPRNEGSGFIIDAARGYVITNHHVVADATAIHIRLADGRESVGHVLGVDPKSDLAVLKIAADRLHELPWGDSETLEVGDEVLAVGNPFGLEGTVSRGIISAKNRSNILLHDTEYQGFLQTDAVINPGNSGGPLVNLRGEVVGVNTAIATHTGNYDGIGFAIPARRVVKLLPQLIRGQKITRGYLGVAMAAGPRLEETKRRLGWNEPGGVLIREVMPDSPAAQSDLRVDDIIVECRGRAVRSSADVIDLVGETTPGTILEFKIWREGGLHRASVTVGAQPEGFSTRGWRPSKE